MIECNITDGVSYETIRRTLKKNELKPWLKQCWCIPPKANAGFVCAMEDTLEDYQRNYTENEVLIYMDETSKQHTKETRKVPPMRPGEAEIFDFEYERKMSVIYLCYVPHLRAGGRANTLNIARPGA